MIERDRSVQQRLCEFQRHLRKMLPLVEGLLRADEVLELEAASQAFQNARAAGHAESMFYVERYGRTRFWALYEGDALLVVTVYKRGAEMLRDRLQTQDAQMAELSQALQRARAEGHEPSPRSGAVGQEAQEPGGEHRG